jgi:hypothetical protein
MKIGAVPYRMARGGPIAFFLVVSFVWLIVLAELFDTATTLVFGFPAFDLSTLNTNYSQGAAIQDVLNGLLDDARFLPFRLYTLFLLFVAMRLLWPLVKLHALPSFKPIRRFKRYVFLAPRELRSLLYIFRNHVFWNPGIPVASFRALGAYCLYAIFLFNALYVAFYISDSRWQAVIVKILWQKLELRTTSSLVGGQLAVIALCLALFLVSFLISGYFLRCTKRLTAMTADVRRAIDERPPVLYLRSFRNDALPANDTSQGLSRYFDPYRERSNLEELIVSCCKGSGPVVAIGDPKTHVQPTGAARMWRHTSWHDMVIKLMSKSAEIRLMAVKTSVHVS